MKTENVVIIGAGQAGLATSYFLTQSKVDHVVLEAGCVAETWRSRRWDSFCLVTPNWSVQLPGGLYDGPEPDGFMSRLAIVDHFQRWSDSIHAPVREQSAVTALDADVDAFVLTTTNGKLRAKTVVVASGGYQRPHLPANADQMPKGVTQLFAEEYHNPSALEPGAVLIIGSGQTGCQLSEDLHRAGRKVFLSCGRCPWAPRRMGGHDLVWWLIETGFWQRTMATLPSPAARLLGNPQTTGRDGGHDLNYRTLHTEGIELVGRYVGTDGNKIHFGDDLVQSIQAGDDLARALMKWVVALCEERGMPVPWEVPPPPGFTSRTELDVDQDKITTVIWTSGYRPAYDWIHLPVFDDLGFPVQVDGRSSVPGLYFMGVHFMRKAQSAVLYGVGEDAEVVAGAVAEQRK